ncbi:methyl-accepting chemotaxis protein [Rhodobium orientis]|uniref:Methyl-accepting transducer domain-containing protein n=1 Tax=Rhodobium orientis TaxID=34017 RepID=A0A327JPC8_9HYPH|nr:cache domain-containing protein [Rhodobium orientis]MBB4304828.1 methyl-accepting chemotaxis protein [Rhodobium orientis]MBK5948000.1 hypothetical protein [Rhodobium orientis]RAI27436.1 hypothetical protein CH339_10105 [Rhodobium orientis]
MKTIRARMMLAIGALAVLGAVSTIAIAQWVSSDLISTALRNEVESTKQQLRARIEADSRQALVLAEVIAGQTRIQQLFAAGDREALATEFLAAFPQLKKQYGIRQFQFHLPPATSFLRVHKAEKFGDDLSGFRKTVVETNDKKMPISGLEKGVAGIGIRGVVPVSFEGRHVGSVEFGLGFHDLFVREFAEETGHPSAIFRFADAGPEIIGNQLPEEMDATALLEETADGGISAASGDYFVEQMPIPDFSGNPVAVALIAVDQTGYQATAAAARNVGIGVAVLLLLIAGGTLYFSSRSIFAPLRTVTDHVVELADGRTGFKVEGEARHDEIGEIARAVSICRANRVEQDRLEQAQESEHHEQDVRQKRIEALIAGFQSTSQQLLSGVENANSSLKATASTLEQVARSSAKQANSATDASKDASDNVQSVAVAAEELASSIEEISNQVERTTGIVEKATSGAKATNEKVAGLAQAASKIGEIITLIQAIAEQTNLLALNATIEAARAGEAGKGFAVVAAEVKELASQTAKATEEISAQIGAIQSSTDEAVESIGGITATMGEVNEYTNAIAAAVVEQGSATNEISNNIGNAASRTQSAVAGIGELDEAITETNRSASSVLAATEEATRNTEAFRAEIEKFLADVAAA